MIEVVVLVPVLRRPHRVAPLLESWRAATPDGRSRLLFITSPNDDEERIAIAREGGEQITFRLRPGPGDYARKINFAHRATTEPVLFLGADDLAFHPHWLEIGLEMIARGWHVVGTNDLGNERVTRGEHSTHSFVTRDYVDRLGTIDRPGQVLHPGYPHEFVDDEFIATAKFRNAFAFAADCIVEHLHPNWGKAPSDKLYAAQPSRMRTGRVLFKRRQRLWASR